MSQPQQRPAWLPPGHAFCPGKHEEVRVRRWMNDPNAVQNILTCEHGEYASQAEAWQAHARFRPIEGSPGQCLQQDRAQYREDLKAAYLRVNAFLDSRANARGMDPELIYVHNDNELRTSDLRLLLTYVNNNPPQ